MPVIRYFQEQARYKPPHPRKTSQWILSVIKSEKNQAVGINFIFCSDRYLETLNLEYLAHRTLTDVITFDYSDPSGIQGDIFISVDRVRENSEKFLTNLDEEIHRVMIHGVLHLLGYTDKSRTAKALMRKKEDAYLSLRG
jgi:rRNA maturation RNase YbeY